MTPTEDKQGVVEWLLSSGDVEAAHALERCDLNTLYVDSVIEVAGERMWDLIDLEVVAPRNVYSAPQEIKSRVEAALRECLHVGSVAVRHVSWVPQLARPAGPLDIEGAGHAVAPASRNEEKANHLAEVAHWAEALHAFINKSPEDQKFFSKITFAVTWLKDILGPSREGTSTSKSSIREHCQVIDQFYANHMGPSLAETKPAIRESKSLYDPLSRACRFASAMDDAGFARDLADGMSHRPPVTGEAPSERRLEPDGPRLPPTSPHGASSPPTWRRSAWKWVMGVVGAVVATLISSAVIDSCRSHRAKLAEERTTRPRVEVAPLTEKPYFVICRDSMSAKVGLSFHNRGKEPVERCEVVIEMSSLARPSFGKWSRKFVDQSLVAAYLEATEETHIDNLVVRWRTREPVAGDTVYLHTAVQYLRAANGQVLRNETIDALVVTGVSEVTTGLPAVRTRVVGRSMHEH